MLTVEVYNIAMYSMPSFSREESILPSRLSIFLYPTQNLYRPLYNIYPKNKSKKVCLTKKLYLYSSFHIDAEKMKEDRSAFTLQCRF